MIRKSDIGYKNSVVLYYSLFIYHDHTSILNFQVDIKFTLEQPVIVKYNKHLKFYCVFDMNTQSLRRVSRNQDHARPEGRLMTGQTGS